MAAAFIAGDWGISHLTLALCDDQGNALETRRGPGAAGSRGRFDAVFDATAADWIAHGLPVLLCGSVGASFGWREAPYLACPANLNALTGATVAVRDGLSIVPGLRCTNPLGAPDVMRGEETQLLGAGVLDASMRAGPQLVCLPGTHAKWVSLDGGAVHEFLTAPTGEMFAALRDRSVLVRDTAAAFVHDPVEFERGLAAAAERPEVSLLHKVFQARSLRLHGRLAPDSVPSWLSGLLIGTDVAGALALFAGHDTNAPVHVIGAPRLAALYSIALGRHGRNCFQIDGARAALAGLAVVHRGQQRRQA